ncbi:MAG: carboxymuconolactone decarboxylase family protein [Alphaproteobacteria bacterium]
MMRKDFAAEGAALAGTLGLSAPDGAPGLAEFAAEAGFASLWARPALEPADRMIAVLATLASLQRLPQLRAHVGPALDLGHAPRAIQEIIVQCGLYGGLPVAENALAVAAEVFRERGLAAPEATADEADMMAMSRDALHEEGIRIMQSIHGERSQDGYAAPEDPATSALYEVAIRYGYGVIWSRPGLDWRQRMFVALAAFTALRLPATLTKFAQSALDQGVTREQVVEAIMQTAPYGGFPPALTALTQIRPVLFPEK